jgi:SAM-dependent methyltransferase
MKMKESSSPIHHRKFVGPIEKYDVMSAIQFIHLYQIGLRGNSTLLEIGAGSLRAAKLLIPFLEPGRYFGIEPDKHLVDAGFDFELGRGICNIKSPKFVYNKDFNFSELGLPSTGVDFAIAQSIFSHTSLNQFSHCLQNTSPILNESGILLATFVQGDKDYDGSDWVYPECVKFRKETVEKIAASASLHVRFMKWVHPNDQTWMLFSKSSSSIEKIPASDDVVVVDYIRRIEELSKRINYAKSLMPVRIGLWIRNLLIQR